MLPLVAIYGYSNSGKTTFLTELVRKLTERDHRVCTIKHTPAEVSLDSEGKDTWKHVDSGSALTVFSTDAETDLIFPEPLELEEILELVSLTGECDIVLAEGFKSSPAPKIAVGDIDRRDGTLMRVDGNVDEAIEVVEKEIRVAAVENQLPGLDCGLCGNDSCREMAVEVEEGKRKIDDCKVTGSGNLKLVVDGEEIPLENFPANIIKYGVKGMLETLKGVTDDVSHVSLEADY
ncbi:molybdopterin-guanine dinucleotide biosynthesis protein B [Candidatus Bipolaricaulota bacterium]|nr:molybdopterin-guanine dinucleotide biosynthesis protein B [Candidatus Bipolaricaulota bacterium]